jgi:hypothetical protein
LEIGMTKVAAGITTSVDGYITGPNDGPERGLGEGGERLHYWVTSVTLEPMYSSPLATHIYYRVVR